MILRSLSLLSQSSFLKSLHKNMPVLIKTDIAGLVSLRMNIERRRWRSNVFIAFVKMSAVFSEHICKQKKGFVAVVNGR